MIYLDEHVVILGDPPGDEAYRIECDGKAQRHRAETGSSGEVVVQTFDLPPAGESLMVGDLRISAIAVSGGAPFYLISHS